MTIYQNKQKPYLIGLAGQSCAGKNTAAYALAEKGYPVIDADCVVHALLQEQKEILCNRYQAVAHEQGIRLCHADGALNTRALGAVLFRHSALLHAHEAFIFPLIEHRIQALIDKAFSCNPFLPIVLNAPTLHKTRFLHECQFVFYIEAPYIMRFLRCKKRDRISWRLVVNRFSHQKNFLSQYLKKNADIVRVVNLGSEKQLKKKIEQILRQKGF